MRREEVDFEAVPMNAGLAQAFLHKDFAIEAPEAAADTERGEVDTFQFMFAENGESGTAQGQQVAIAARVEDAEVGGVI